MSSCSASLRRKTYSLAVEAPYTANPVESGPRCLRLLSMAVISLPTLVTPSRWMSPAIPHIFLFSSLLPRATASLLERGSLAASSGQAVEISLEVPFRHRMQEALPLVALIFVVETVHFARHRRANDGVLLKRGKRVAKRHRQLLHLLAGFHGLIDVALLGRTRIEIVLQPIVHGHEQRPGHQMRVHHGIDGAIFEAARRRDAQAGGAVLIAPIREHRGPEARVPQPPIGIHGRAANRRQCAEMGDDAADRLKPDLARKLDVVGVRHEGVVAATRIHEVLLRAGELLGVVAERLNLVLATTPKRD